MNAILPSSGSNEITDAEFEAIAQIAVTEAGLSIPNTKKSLVQSRIARRLRKLGLRDFQEYLRLVANDKAETRELISVLTTNVSSFYREAHHFEFLRNTVIPDICSRPGQSKKARFWSAGCSSGQEPYTLAMELLKTFPSASATDLLILATDIDPAILSRAKRGEYGAQDLSVLEDADRKRYFAEEGSAPDTYAASCELRKIIRFRELNLHGPWPMKSAFDVIFCRNVVIYFDDAHQRALWPRFRDHLVPGGWLILGHSERIQDTDASGFRTAGVTVYQKT